MKSLVISHTLSSVREDDRECEITRIFSRPYLSLGVYCSTLSSFLLWSSEKLQLFTMFVDKISKESVVMQN